MDFDLTSVGAIIALTLTIVQTVKSYLPAAIPTKVVAIAIGAALTALAYYGLHTITGSLPAILAQVILGVLGAPGLFEILNRTSAK